MRVEVLAVVRVQLLFMVGGWEKSETNAILNSVEVKVEVGVELGNIKLSIPSKSMYRQKEREFRKIHSKDFRL